MGNLIICQHLCNCCVDIYQRLRPTNKRCQYTAKCMHVSRSASITQPGSATNRQFASRIRVTPVHALSVRCAVHPVVRTDCTHASTASFASPSCCAFSAAAMYAFALATCGGSFPSPAMESRPWRAFDPDMTPQRALCCAASDQTTSLQL
jgi:hypothetical protein